MTWNIKEMFLSVKEYCNAFGWVVYISHGCPGAVNLTSVHNHKRKKIKAALRSHALVLAP